MLLQTRCAGCDRAGAALCRTCRFALAGPPPARRTEWREGGVISALAFTGRVRDVLLGFKYRNRRQVGAHLAGIVVNRVLAAGVRPGVDVDAVTWAPTSRRRRRERGFDQAEVVARRVALQLGLPAQRLLERDDAGHEQTGLDRARRLHGPTFRARPGLARARVLLIDDVVTTGATLRAAADALYAAGAWTVVTAAVAATPDRVPAGGSVLTGPWQPAGAGGDVATGPRGDARVRRSA